MALPLEKTDRPFTYGDYLTWPDEERWEIIDGIPMNMGPVPMRRHQKILGDLYFIIRTELKKGKFL